jgi:O-antigen ligase
MMMWSDALKIFQRYPLFGAGTGAYQHEAKKIDPENSLPHPHNSYLYILVNYGMLGIGLYGWLLLVTLKRSWRARDRLSGHSILAFLFVILIGSLTDTQVLSAATGIALGFISGIPTPPPTQCAS